MRRFNIFEWIHLYAQCGKTYWATCLASDTHAVKLPAHSLCADVSARGGLELCSYCVNRALVTQRPCSLTAIWLCF